MAGSSGKWIGDPGVFHGEGAYWDTRAGVLRYVDMLRGDVITHWASRDERTNVGSVAALIRSRTAGGYVVATEQGFALLDDDLGIEREIAVFDDPAVRMNEGACDAAGRLYCGSLDYTYRPGAGTLYRLDPDLSVHVALESMTIPNGLVWPQSGVAAHADTADRKVYRYEFDLVTGVFGDRDVLIDFADVEGSPDGMALDAEGGLWIALWGGREVRRYDSSGLLTDTIPLEVSNPTSCAIGGGVRHDVVHYHVTTGRARGGRRSGRPRTCDRRRYSSGPK